MNDVEEYDQVELEIHMKASTQRTTEGMMIEIEIAASDVDNGTGEEQDRTDILYGMRLYDMQSARQSEHGNIKLAKNSQ
jgi:hypothetical protein